MFLFDGYGMKHREAKQLIDENDFQIVDREKNNLCQPYLTKYVGSNKSEAYTFYRVKNIVLDQPEISKFSQVCERKASGNVTFNTPDPKHLDSLKKEVEEYAMNL
jgi:hypothetical protein